jgi:hypothetical protein
MLSQENYNFFSDAPLRAGAVYIEIPQAFELYLPFAESPVPRPWDVWCIEVDD